MPQPKYYQNLETTILSTNALDVSGSLGLRGVTVVSPASGSSVKVSVAAPGVIVAPSGGLADVTLQFPNNPADGQIVFVSFTQHAAKVTFTNGKFANASVLGPAVSAGDSIVVFFNGETGKWYKLSGSTKGPSVPSPAPTPSPAPATPDTPAPTGSDATASSA